MKVVVCHVKENNKYYMIKLNDISKSFKNKKALDKLSLEVSSGEIYGLLGANGAGKSTTLNLLLGFLRADSGSIEIIDSTNNKTITNNEIGYIPENVNLYPYLSGLENLDYFCRIAGIKFNSSELKSLLNECGLEQDAYNKPTSDYSKGMRQKVGIAIALAKNAKIYLLDEILKKLSSKGATILMASHDLFRVRETCDKIGILKQGSLIKEMFSKDVTSNELENIYLSFMQS